MTDPDSHISPRRMLDAFSAQRINISITDGKGQGIPVEAETEGQYLAALVSIVMRTGATLLVFNKWPFRRFNGSIYSEVSFMKREGS